MHWWEDRLVLAHKSWQESSNRIFHAGSCDRVMTMSKKEGLGAHFSSVGFDMGNIN
jgi:hypothetical protein